MPSFFSTLALHHERMSIIRMDGPHQKILRGSQLTATVSIAARRNHRHTPATPANPILSSSLTPSTRATTSILHGPSTPSTR